MTSIYVVKGMTGELTNRKEWLVHAYTESAEAKQAVTKLHKELRKLTQRDLDTRFDALKHQTIALKNFRKLDPGFQIDYMGTRYYAVTVPMAVKIKTTPKKKLKKNK